MINIQGNKIQVWWLCNWDQTNHVAFDGIGFNHFLQNLAALAGDKPLAVVPCNERELLATRSPPRVMFTHPQSLKLEDTPTS